ncbi:MAG: glucose-6-phosphate dehydrogenase assembly protein OpcA, partial [Chloroflexota bacterium]
NLTAVARSVHEAEHVAHTVIRLGDLYPSRATILVADHETKGSEDGLIDVDITLLEQEPSKSRPAVRFETIRVHVDSGKEAQLASIASPLLVADLQDFLWWASSSGMGSPLFNDLASVSDRVIVDTATVRQPAVELHHLAAIVAEGATSAKLSDVAWQRLTPWRNLIAQFFDHPRTQGALDLIDEVDLTFGTGKDGLSGFTGALLIAGWLGSSLGWEAPGDLVPIRGSEDGWRVTLRSGAGTHHREVLLKVTPAEDPIAGCGLASVTALAHGGRDGTFRLERVGPGEVSARSEVPGMPTTRRMAFAPQPDDATLLGEELRQFGRDGTFEAALLLATTLAPDITLH